MVERVTSKKLNPVEGLVLVLVCLLVLGVVPLACRKSRSDAFRIECARNLSLIGRAMLAYANDYDGELPRSGGRNSLWAPVIPDWQASNRRAALRRDIPDGGPELSRALRSQAGPDPAHNQRLSAAIVFYWVLAPLEILITDEA